jgi:hypothetical protein
MVVTVPLRRAGRPAGTGTLDDGHRLNPAHVRRLACDAAIIPIVLGGDGQPLDVGRSRRLITGPLRRTLTARDHGCCFPACERPARWGGRHHTNIGPASAEPS